MIRQNIFSTGAQKLLLFPDHLNNWKKGVAVPPITLEIQPSEVCNHHCPQCQGQFVLSKMESIRRATKGAFLDFSLLNSIWNNPPQGIIISGNTGDPLLYPDILQLLSKMDENRIPSVIITNGEALTNDLVDPIIEITYGIRISLDSHNSSTFLESHGVKQNHWEKVLENISALVKSKQKHPLSNCLIGVAFLTNENSKSWMIPATNLAKKVGVDYIQFRPFHYDKTNVTNILKECEKSETDTFKVFSSYQKYSKFGYTQEQQYKGCQAAWFYTVLDARGDFYICCHNIGNPNAKLGTLNEQSWKEFIHSIHRRNIINTFNNQVCIPNCRLHTQNELLTWVRSTPPSETKSLLTMQIQSHAVFL